MNYTDPRSVRTPKKRITGNIDVLHDTGEWGWSLCRIIWDGKQSLGIRWNGSFSENNMGNPQSRGNATWFILPDEITDLLLRDGSLIDSDD